MAWVYLLTAGALEIVWATGLKRLGDSFSWGGVLVTAVALVASMVALYAATARLPLGIAYPIWTGIGSVGSVIVSVVIFQQSMSIYGVLGVFLMISGMVLLGAEAH
ncbi:SMR family transporter [Gymnodinialimonas sp. 57CJ19]|uniref:DMT family transporter n=1 Tax=Gymnodinialimonas sp. 57CJ19 TaxID=3138498 RepID=UPI003134295B